MTSNPPAWVDNLLSLYARHRATSIAHQGPCCTLEPGAIIPGPVPTGPDPVLVRADYLETYAAIMEQRQTLIKDLRVGRRRNKLHVERNAFVIHGDPGMGKTTSLSVIAVACVLNEVPVIVTDGDGQAFYILRDRAIEYHQNLMVPNVPVCLLHPRSNYRDWKYILLALCFVMTWSIGTPDDCYSLTKHCPRRTVFYTSRPWPFADSHLYYLTRRPPNESVPEDASYTPSDVYRLVGPHIPTAAGLLDTPKSSAGPDQDFRQERARLEALIRLPVPVSWPDHTQNGFKHLTAEPHYKQIRDLFLTFPRGRQPVRFAPSFRYVLRSRWIVHLLRQVFQTSCPLKHRALDWTDDAFGGFFECFEFFYLKNRKHITLVCQLHCPSKTEVVIPVFKGGSPIRSGSPVDGLEAGSLYPFEADPGSEIVSEAHSVVDAVGIMDNQKGTVVLVVRDVELAIYHASLAQQAVDWGLYEALRRFGEDLPEDPYEDLSRDYSVSPHRFRRDYLILFMAWDSNGAQHVISESRGAPRCIIPMAIVDCSLQTDWPPYQDSNPEDDMDLLTKMWVPAT